MLISIKIKVIAFCDAKRPAKVALVFKKSFFARKYI